VPTILLPILPGTLPPGICFSNEQERLNTFAEYMEAQLAAGMAFYNYGDSAPQPAYQSYPWLRTQDMRWYYFESVWKSPIPTYSLYERRIWVGDTTQLQTYDGGDANPLSTISGPTWEVDTTFAGYSPMGVGTIPGSDPSKTLSLLEQYGVGSQTLLIANLPEHSHTLGFASSDTGSGFPQAGNGSTEAETYTTSEVGSDTPFSIVHPVVGVYLVKRTIRTFYVAT
jgi:hypothetical protein